MQAKRASLCVFVSILSCAIATATAQTTAKPTGLDGADQLAAVPSGQSTQAAFAWTELQNGVQVRVDGTVKNVLFYGPRMVRVNTTLGPVHTTQPSLAVIVHPEAIPFRVDEKPGQLIVASTELTIAIDKQTGALTFMKPDGEEITRERAEKPAELKQVTISGEPTYEVKQTFALAADESLYGLGQYNDSYMDYRGQEVLLVQTNIGSVVPMLVSTRRYGILWDIYSKSIFKDSAEGASFWAESAPAGVDYYFMAADEMDGVIAGYRKLTGQAPMFARQAYGLFMSKERY